MRFASKSSWIHGSVTYHVKLIGYLADRPSLLKNYRCILEWKCLTWNEGSYGTVAHKVNTNEWDPTMIVSKYSHNLENYFPQMNNRFFSCNEWKHTSALSHSSKNSFGRMDGSGTVEIIRRSTRVLLRLTCNSRLLRFRGLMNFFILNGPQTSHSQCANDNEYRTTQKLKTSVINMWCLQ